MSLPTSLENQQPNNREATNIAARIETSAQERRVPQMLQGLYDLVCLGSPEAVKQIPPVGAVLTKINGDELLKLDLMELVISTLNQKELRRDGESVRRLVGVAGLVRIDDPQVQSYLNRLKKEYFPSPNPNKKQPGRRVSRRSIALGLAAGGLGGFLVQTAPNVLNLGASVAASKQEPSGSSQAVPPESPTAAPTVIEPSSTATQPAETKVPPLETIPPPTKTLEPPTKTPTKLAPPTKTVTSSPSPSPSASPTKVPPAETPKPPTAIPTPDVIKQAEKEAGAVNIAEYLFGTFIEASKKWRREKYLNDPAFAERIEGLNGTPAERKARAEKILASDELTFVYLGIDETRERAREFSNNQWGRSDVVMLIRFNPHTLVTKAVTFPRDLFAPELTPYGFSGGARINAATMVNYLNKQRKDQRLHPINNEISSHEIMEQILESATGLPIDAIFQTNIDFMQGWVDKNGEVGPGIFDDLFPEGLLIDVKSRLRDPNYPIDAYRDKILDIRPGRQLMHGREITEYSRTRIDSADGRNQRQRQVLFVAIKELAGLDEAEEKEEDKDKGIIQNIPWLKDTKIGKGVQDWLNQKSKDVQTVFKAGSLLGEVVTGNTTRFDKLIEALKYQEANHNMTDNFNIIQRLEEMRAGVKSLGGSPLGVARLIKYGWNSKDLFRKYKNNPDRIQDVAITRGNLLINADPNSRYYWLYMQQVGGSNMNQGPTPRGNFINYWQPIRNYLQPFLG